MGYAPPLAALLSLLLSARTVRLERPGSWATLFVPQSSWTSGPLTSLLRSSSSSSRRHRRFTPVVSWRHRQQPKRADENNRRPRTHDPGRRGAAEQRRAGHHEQRVHKQEPGPPAGPQDPHQTRGPAAGWLACRGGNPSGPTAGALLARLCLAAAAARSSPRRLDADDAPGDP